MRSTLAMVSPTDFEPLATSAFNSASALVRSSSPLARASRAAVACLSNSATVSSMPDMSDLLEQVAILGAGLRQSLRGFVFSSSEAVDVHDLQPTARRLPIDQRVHSLAHDHLGIGVVEAVLDQPFPRQRGGLFDQ